MLSRFSPVRLFGTLWTVVCQVPGSMGIPQARILPPGDLPDPGIELVSPAALALQVDSLPLSLVP